MQNSHSLDLNELLLTTYDCLIDWFENWYMQTKWLLSLIVVWCGYCSVDFMCAFTNWYTLECADYRLYIQCIHSVYIVKYAIVQEIDCLLVIN